MDPSNLNSNLRNTAAGLPHYHQGSSPIVTNFLAAAAVAQGGLRADPSSLLLSTMLSGGRGPSFTNGPSFSDYLTAAAVTGGYPANLLTGSHHELLAHKALASPATSFPMNGVQPMWPQTLQTMPFGTGSGTVSFGAGTVSNPVAAAYAYYNAAQQQIDNDNEQLSRQIQIPARVQLAQSQAGFTAAADNEALPGTILQQQTSMSIGMEIASTRKFRPASPAARTPGPGSVDVFSQPSTSSMPGQHQSHRSTPHIFHNSNSVPHPTSLIPSPPRPATTPTSSSPSSVRNLHQITDNKCQSPLLNSAFNNNSQSHLVFPTRSNSSQSELSGPSYHSSPLNSTPFGKDDQSNLSFPVQMTSLPSSSFQAFSSNASGLSTSYSNDLLNSESMFSFSVQQRHNEGTRPASNTNPDLSSMPGAQIGQAVNVNDFLSYPNDLTDSCLSNISTLCFNPALQQPSGSSGANSAHGFSNFLTGHVDPTLNALVDETLSALTGKDASLNPGAHVGGTLGQLDLCDAGEKDNSLGDLGSSFNFFDDMAETDRFLDDTLLGSADPHSLLHSALEFHPSLSSLGECTQDDGAVAACSSSTSNGRMLNSNATSPQGSPTDGGARSSGGGGDHNVVSAGGNGNNSSYLTTPKIREKFKMRKERELAEIDMALQRHLNLVAEKHDPSNQSNRFQLNQFSSCDLLPMLQSADGVNNASNSDDIANNNNCGLDFGAAATELPSCSLSLTSSSTSGLLPLLPTTLGGSLSPLASKKSPSPVRFSPFDESEDESGDESSAMNARISQIADAFGAGPPKPPSAATPKDLGTTVFIPCPSLPGCSKAPSTSGSDSGKTSRSAAPKTRPPRVPIYKQANTLRSPLRPGPPGAPGSSSSSCSTPHNNNLKGGASVFRGMASRLGDSNSKSCDRDSPYSFTDDEDNAADISQILKEKKVEEEVTKKLHEISSLHPELKMAAIKQATLLVDTTTQLHRFSGLKNEIPSRAGTSTSFYHDSEKSASLPPIDLPSSLSGTAGPSVASDFDNCQSSSDLLKHVIPKKRRFGAHQSQPHGVDASFSLACAAAHAQNNSSAKLHPFSPPANHGSAAEGQSTVADVVSSVFSKVTGVSSPETCGSLSPHWSREKGAPLRKSVQRQHSSLSSDVSASPIAGHTSPTAHSNTVEDVVTSIMNNVLKGPGPCFDPGVSIVGSTPMMSSPHRTSLNPPYPQNHHLHSSLVCSPRQNPSYSDGGHSNGPTVLTPHSSGNLLPKPEPSTVSATPDSALTSASLMYPHSGTDLSMGGFGIPSTNRVIKPEPVDDAVGSVETDCNQEHVLETCYQQRHSFDDDEAFDGFTPADLEPVFPAGLSLEPEKPVINRPSLILRISKNVLKLNKVPKTESDEQLHHGQEIAHRRRSHELFTDEGEAEEANELNAEDKERRRKKKHKKKHKKQKHHKHDRSSADNEHDASSSLEGPFKIEDTNNVQIQSGEMTIVNADDEDTSDGRLVIVEPVEEQFVEKPIIGNQVLDDVYDGHRHKNKKRKKKHKHHKEDREERNKRRRGTAESGRELRHLEPRKVELDTGHNEFETRESCTGEDEEVVESESVDEMEDDPSWKPSAVVRRRSSASLKRHPRSSRTGGGALKLRTFGGHRRKTRLLSGDAPSSSDTLVLPLPAPKRRRRVAKAFGIGGGGQIEPHGSFSPTVGAFRSATPATTGTSAGRSATPLSCTSADRRSSGQNIIVQNESCAMSSLSLVNNTPVLVRGSFVIAKDDVGTADCPIWRVDNQNLLQKFVPVTNNGQVQYQSTSTYSGWCTEQASRYIGVTVRFVEQSRNHATVKLDMAIQDLVPAIATEIYDSIEAGGMSPPECDQNGGPRGTPHPDQPWSNALDTYLHALVLHALSKNFLQRVNSSWDVGKHIAQIESINLEKRAQLLSNVKWQQSFKDLLEWYPFLSVSEADQSGLLCQACDGRSVEVSVQLYGEPYCQESLLTKSHRTTLTGSPMPSQEFHCCSLCANIAESYHRLYHMKYNLYRKCEDKVELISEEAGVNLEPSMVTEQCLRNRVWVHQVVHEYVDQWQKIG